MTRIDPEAIRAVRDRAAAQAAIPNMLRQAREGAPAFEDRAVRAVLKYGGMASPAAVAAHARRRRQDGLLDFAAFHAACDFPLPLAAARLRFHYDGLATDLLNAPGRTVLWSAYADLKEARGEQPFALVFRWPRVKNCRGWCVMHQAVMLDMHDGFRLLLPVAGGLYAVEPLPAFLAAWGYSAGRSEGEDGDGGGDDRGEDDGG